MVPVTRREKQEAGLIAQVQVIPSQKIRRAFKGICSQRQRSLFNVKVRRSQTLFRNEMGKITREEQAEARALRS